MRVNLSLNHSCRGLLAAAILGVAARRCAFVQVLSNNVMN